MKCNYDHLTSIPDLNDRIKFMATVNLKTDPQPWCFTQHLWDVKDATDPFEAADNAARAFKARNGLVIIEAEASYCRGKFMTIMDEFDMVGENNAEPVGNWLLKRAFEKAGFKYAAQCNESELRMLYAQAGYDGFRQ